MCVCDLSVGDKCSLFRGSNEKVFTELSNMPPAVSCPALTSPLLFGPQDCSSSEEYMMAAALLPLSTAFYRVRKLIEKEDVCEFNVMLPFHFPFLCMHTVARSSMYYVHYTMSHLKYQTLNIHINSVVQKPDTTFHFTFFLPFNLSCLQPYTCWSLFLSHIAVLSPPINLRWFHFFFLAVQNFDKLPLSTYQVMLSCLSYIIVNRRQWLCGH